MHHHKEYIAIKNIESLNYACNSFMTFLLISCVNPENNTEKWKSNSKNNIKKSQVIVLRFWYTF